MLSGVGRQSTFRSVAQSQMEALCRSLGLEDTTARKASSIFEALAPWHDAKIPSHPTWESDITDDGTPYEYSVAFASGSPELRLLVEPQANPYSLLSNWSEGVAVQNTLASMHGADTSLFSKIRGVFEPDAKSQGRFALWHGAVIEPSGKVFFKAYVNPQLHGGARAWPSVQSALHELGMSEAIAFLRDRLREPAEDLAFFSIDLVESANARVKVYVARRRSAYEVQQLIQGSQNVDTEEVLRWIKQLAGGEGPYHARPIVTCFAFRQGHLSPTATVHVPICCYSPNDQDSLARAEVLLTHLDAKRLRNAVNSIIRVPLHKSSGAITYVALRQEAKVLRSTVYLSPQLYEVSYDT